jgi:hypothetical protein
MVFFVSIDIHVLNSIKILSETYFHSYVKLNTTFYSEYIFVFESVTEKVDGKYSCNICI